MTRWAKDVDPATIPKPLDPAVANHVAAVVLFGLGPLVVLPRVVSRA